MKAVIEARDLNKSFAGGVVAVSGLDLEVAAGAVYGLIGRNGAGKTTTLRLLLGLLRADHGAARVLGEDLWHARRDVRQRVAYVSQRQQLPGWMTVEELCRYLAHFYERWDAEGARRLARRWELPWRRTVARLSGGEQRLAAVLLAVAARPEVLFLDEPGAGLDPIARRAMLRSLVDTVAGNDDCAVLVSTHLISDLERVATHVGVMDRGRIVRTAALEELLEGTRRVQVVFDEPAPPRGFSVPGAIRARTTGPVVTAIVHFTGEAQFDPIRELPGARVNLFPMGLEEIFVEVFGTAASEDEAGGAEAGPAVGERAIEPPAGGFGNN